MSNKVSVELEAKVSGFQKGMKDASDSMKQYETDTRKISESTVNLKKELGQARREAMNLAAGYAKLSQEAKNSDFGKEMKRQLDEAKESAANLIDLQGDVQQELKNMANDTRMLSTLGEGVGLIGDAFAATTGIIAQFTGNEQDAQRAVVAFTTAQSALGTVTKLQNALQKQSNIMLAVGKVQTMTATAAENAKTEATIAGTVAQKAMNAVAKANPYVLLATAVIGVTVAIWGFVQATKTQESELQKLQRIREEVHNTSIEGLKDAQSEITHMQTLRSRIEDETLSRKERIKACKELRAMNPDVFKGLKDEAILAGNAAGAYEKLANSIIATAKAKAYEQKITENQKNIIDLEEQIKKQEQYNKRVKALRESAVKNMPNPDAQAGAFLMGTVLKDNGESNLKQLDEQKKEYEQKGEEYKKAMQELQKDIISNSGSSGGGGSKTVETETQRLQKHIQALEEEYVKLGNVSTKEANDRREAIRNLIQEDYKRLDQIKLLKEQSQGKLLGGDVDTKNIVVDGSMVSYNIPKMMQEAQRGLGTLKLPVDSHPLLELAASIKHIRELMEAAPNKDVYQYYKKHLEELEKQQAEFTGENVANETAESWRSAASAIGSVGSAMSSIDDPSAKIAGIIGQAIATIASAYAQALSTDWTSKSSIWSFIAAAAASTASMLATIGSIKSATSGYAEGGIVGGSSYAGDRINARLNSGEMVLNQRQQRNLFNLLDTSAMPQPGGNIVQVQGVIHGTDLLLVQKNTNKVRSKAGTSINF